MKYLILLALLISNTYANEFYIGIIDTEYIIKNIDDGKKMLESIQNKYEKDKQSFQLEQKKILDKREQIEKQKVLITESAYNKKIKNLEKEFVNLKNLETKLQQEILQYEYNLKKPISDRIQKILNELSKKENVIAIIEKNNNPFLVVYKKKDLSSQVVNLYEAKY